MKRTLIVTVCVSAIILSGCIYFDSIDQPFSVPANGSFSVFIETYTEGSFEDWPNSPYFGVCLPTGWSVHGDSVQCTGVYNETIYYDSVIAWDQENASPAPEGYYWWAGSGPLAWTPEGFVYGEVLIQTDDQSGCFSLDYMLGSSEGGVNQERSDNHLIEAVGDHMAREFQAVEDDNSVHLFWQHPADTAGLLGYNIYRDQELINSDPVVDTFYTDGHPLYGAQYYTLSSLYDDGDEHLIPCDRLLFFGEFAYVSPEGDDSNDGSSFDDAFLTITHAKSLITPDSLHPKTIVLAAGIYSPDSTGEEFPIEFKNYMSLAGSGYERSVLDADSIYINALEFEFVDDVSVSALAITNAEDAIFCFGSDPIIDNIRIGESSTAIDCRHSDPAIQNVMISESRRGIRCHASSPAIYGSTISGNTLFGIDIDVSSNLQITNTIVWGNSGDLFIDQDSSVVISYCDIPGNWEGEGNININPMFVDPENGDYNVCTQSACIDSGDPDMQDPDGTRADIGFFYPEHPECEVGNIWYVSTDGNDTSGDGSAENPFRTIQHAIDESFHLDTIVVESGTYVENLYIYIKSILLASDYMFSGDTLDIQNTIIDGDSAATVVTFDCCDSLAAITGFTIRNGYAQRGAGINSYNSSAEISNNIISGNTSADVGGIICLIGSPLIINNQISGNITNSWGYAGGIYCSSSDARINGNIIFDNTSNAIRCSYSNDIISGNVIYENSASAIVFIDSNPLVINNTIYRNNRGISCFDSSPEITNNIIWSNNEGEIFIWGNSSPLVDYNDIQGGWEGEGNINTDPLFRGPGNGDLHLMSTECGDEYDSPCIDAGSPVITDSLLDCSWGLGTILSDMGAFGGGDSAEVGVTDDQARIPDKFTLHQNYPNPFNAATTISYTLPEPGEVTIFIYNLLGQRVATVFQGIQEAGKHTVIWDAADFASGVYFARLATEKRSKNIKIMLLK